MAEKFEYYDPKTVKELCKTLDEVGSKTKILAGGTDLIVEMRAGIKKPAGVIDVKKIKELKGIDFDAKKGLRIGSCVTCNELGRNPVIEKKYSILAECAESIASYALRNRATIAGNLCNASPCADMAPGLLVLGALITIVSSSGEKTIKLSDFFTGVKKTVLQPNEFVKEIIIPAEKANSKCKYMKQKRIKGHDLSMVSVAMAVKDKITVAIGSAYITPVVLPEFAKSTKVEKIIEAALSVVKPITDIRSSKEYRLHIIGVYIKRLYEQLVK
ncbi:MAG TPA: xanthine dehydrogenase family protein subunit M [bacterium]|nr:xanthine dehydrogenase family protein subunit M [bacterium]HPN30145.1 xanthine dehydrogenase family protein subunit M [bacterium]